MSKTTDNLQAAFAGESQARNRYTYFARRAAEEGFAQIADIFEETANQECEHALRFFKFFNGGEMEITAAFPAGVIQGTYENLVAAADGERFEHTSMYPGFAAEAEEEGEKEAAMAFKQIAKIEAHHSARYKKLLEMVEAGTVFKREQPIKWKCGICGYIVEGTEPPAKCPSCKKPREYYEPASLDF